MSADDYVAELIAVMRSDNLPEDDIATALLIGAFTVARDCMDPAEWARCLEKGAAIIRSKPVSEEKH